MITKDGYLKLNKFKFKRRLLFKCSTGSKHNSVLYLQPKSKLLITFFYCSSLFSASNFFLCAQKRLH